MEFQKTINSPEITHNDKNSSRFVTKLKFIINPKKITVLTKKLKLKHLLFWSIKHNTII